MGNAEAAVVRNVDKRTSRREHGAYFDAAVLRFRAAPFAAPDQASANAAAGRRCVQVCIRKRPMFPRELEQCEFDVISCLPPGRVVVHDARMHPDMVRMFMNHHDFVFDDAFGETANNDEVYAGTAHELVFEALRGNCGTVMMYGQTGSGKTYTMSAIYERAAKELFANAAGRPVTVCFVELLGDKSFDMFNQGAPCTLSTAADGSVHPYPSVEVPVKNAAELLALIELATKLRATAATGVHDQSSRSHAVCRIFIDCVSQNGDVDAEGCLTLVDLAGSEHRIDNAEHNAERQKEGAKINASLAALKECIRATAAGAKFVAFRQNRLTQLLRGCFVGADRHKTVVIATVSPSSKDTEHSLNTLRHACIMDGQGEAKSGQSAHVSGGTVTKELLGAINVTAIARDRRAQRKSDGGQPPEEWKKPPPAHQAKQSNTAARASLDARCVRALPAELGACLLEARQAWGTERQRARLARVVPVDDPEEPRKEPRQHRAASVGVEYVEHPAARLKSEHRAASVDVERAEDPAARLTSEAASRRASAPAASLEAAQGAMAEGGEGDMISKVGTEHEKALELFRVFCTRGRDAHAWRKNDLRLINSCVVPLLYGNDVQLDWSHPNLALDELERLVGEAPPPAHLLGGDSRQQGRKPPAKPPAMPGSGSAPNTAGQRASLGGSGTSAPRARSASQTRPGREKTEQPPEPAVAAQSRELANSRLRSVSPASRGSSPDGRGPVTHQDAIRARREALEKQRQQTLQKALSKNSRSTAMTSEDEMASIQLQLSQSSCSAAAAVGLKRRLDSLKAAALREERKRKSALSAAPKEQASNSVDNASSGSQPVRPQQEIPIRGHGGRAEEQQLASDILTALTISPQRGAASPSGHGSNGHANDWLPEPARPPPRNSTVQYSSAQTPLIEDFWRPGDCRSNVGDIGHAAVPSAISSVDAVRRRTSYGSPVGAASAPWANEFSNGT